MIFAIDNLSWLMWSSKGGDNIRKFKITLNDGIYNLLIKQADGNDISDYLSKLIKDASSDEANLEKEHFSSAQVSGKSIINHNDTVVLGGSNYVYKLLNADNVSPNRQYQVVDFKKGIISLKQL